MMEKQSKIGTVCGDFDTFQLKSVLVKNDAGDWGSEPDAVKSSLKNYSDTGSVRSVPLYALGLLLGRMIG